MIEDKPRTYNDIIRMKKCYTLTRYYENITENLFKEIYDFLKESSDNKIVSDRSNLYFYDGSGMAVKSVAVIPKDSSFDSITLGNRAFTIVPHYDYDRSSYHGGSSSNNNNNNNNNNNR